MKKGDLLLPNAPSKHKPCFILEARRHPSKMMVRYADGKTKFWMRPYLKANYTVMDMNLKAGDYIISNDDEEVLEIIRVPTIDQNNWTVRDTHTDAQREMANTVLKRNFKKYRSDEDEY